LSSCLNMLVGSLTLNLFSKLGISNWPPCVARAEVIPML
jgi:hypothetical protein